VESVCYRIGTPYAKFGDMMSTNEARMMHRKLGLHTLCCNIGLLGYARSQKLTDKLDIWKNRDLTLRGIIKVLLMKSIGISQMIYLMSTGCVNDNTLTDVQKVQQGVPKVSKSF
jgi:hypothetical protein